jgi:hypothetical protein
VSYVPYQSQSLSQHQNRRRKEKERRRALPKTHHPRQSSSGSSSERLSLVLTCVFLVLDWRKEAFHPHAFLFKPWMIHDIDPLRSKPLQTEPLLVEHPFDLARQPDLKPLPAPSYSYLALGTA